ncbi:ArnT family glycosyltransferase [Herpetosiphon giganteus]|uniref:ArnT family glycosyltransferase n=1 Tax=Herpetosiphon giganteus TaxID=2029754 RepID=UPI00195AE683|nr:glycosyltransferase family 39 protein [Herpetosiphon giganteus]MBM7842831.1 hypothetical protein [Herpetosiphon giganteus]
MLRRFRRRRLALWAVIGAVFGLIWLLRMPLHQLPLERDEAAYAVIARDWADGAIPYRDRFDHKPPFIYAAYAPPILVGAEPVQAIRVWATLWLLVTTLVMWRAGRRLWRSEVAGVLTAILVASWNSAVFLQGVTFNSEAIMLLPSGLALLFGLKALDSGQKAWWMLAGIAAAVAILAKPVGVLIVPALFVTTLAIKGDVNERIGRAILIVDGLALVLIPTVLYFAIAGGWSDFVEANWTYNTTYLQQTNATLGQLWPIWRSLLLLVVAGIIGATLAWRRRRYWPSLIFAGLWSLGLIASAFVSLRAYPHYYQALVPALAVFAGGLAKVRFGFLQQYKDFSIVLIAVLLAILPLSSLWPLYNKTPEAQIEQLYGVDGREFFALAPKVVEWIDSNVGKQTSVWVWAAEPEIYLYGNYAVPSRFPYDYPLAILPNALDETLQQLRSKPPKVIVTYGAVRPMGFDAMLQVAPYRMRVHLGGYDIWVR